MSVSGVAKIMSGGQTGADRAALDFAIEHGIPHGGWCPKGRRAEDGPIRRPIPTAGVARGANFVQRTEGIPGIPTARLSFPSERI